MGCSCFEAFEWEIAMANNSELVQRLRALSMKLASLETVVGRCVREVDVLLELAARIDDDPPATNHPPAQCRIGRFVVDGTTFSVSDGTHVCELGNTVCFRLLEHLAREPNRYFTRSQLLADVWDGQRRAATTIRSAIFALRSRLRTAGMDDLADALRTDGRAYSIRFDDQLRCAQRKTNG